MSPPIPLPRLSFLIRLLHNQCHLPIEIVNLILYKHGGIASPSGVAWRTDRLLPLQLSIHKKLIQRKGAATSEARCWCSGLNLAKVLCEAHAFGTSQQLPLTRHTVHHTSPPLFPMGHITYRGRCSLASLLTRIAADSLLPHTTHGDAAHHEMPSVRHRICHDASAPFIPITIHSPRGAIYAWFVRTYKNVPIAIQDDAEALIYAYYKGA